MKRRVLENLAIAACYYVLGRLALLLAIPPGYATAVWPSAGLAVAAMLAFRYRVWPGIFIGHFFVNLFPSLDKSLEPNLIGALALRLTIAAGGTLQATLGAFLTRSFVGYPNRLEREKDIIRFLLLAGPVSCLVAPTLGTTSLLFSGLVSAADYPFQWFTWWVGDVIGVMLVAPVLVIWAVGRQEVPRRRQLSVTGLLMLMLALVVVFLDASRESEKRRLELEFQARTEAPRTAIEKSLTAYVELVESVANYYMSSSEVTSTDFSRFTNPFLARHPGIQAVGWYPRVDDSDRDEFEQAAQQEGMDPFEIRQLDADGLITHAGHRNEYFPARQLEPQKAAEVLLGFDLGSEPVSLEAVNRARDRGRPIISAPVRIFPPGGQPQVLIVAPAYRAAGTPVTLEQRRRDFMGAAVWLGHVSSIVGDAMRGIPRRGIEIRIEDTSAWPATLLYDSGSGPPLSGAIALQLESAQYYGARNWIVKFYPNRQYGLPQRSWLAWAFLIMGLLLTSLLSALFIGITGHSAAVQRLVSERTVALEAANQELEAFSYSVAHDLRSPLTVILGFSQMLSHSYSDKLDPTGRQYLNKVLTGSMRMKTLIDDLLSLSVVNRAPLSMEQVNFSELAAGIIADFRTQDPARHVVVDIAEGLAAHCDKGLMKIALENLLGNAWKFTAKQPDARIAFTREKTVDGTVFCVRDNGAGFDMERAGRLFAPFQRLHQAGEFEGTGVGLATVARIISRHSGRIWVKAAINEGARFFFTLGQM